MNYFVSCGSVAFGTNWQLLDKAPEEGDVVFVVAWSKVGAVLNGVFAVRGLEELTASPRIAPPVTLSLPALPVPQHLWAELPQPDEVMLDVRLWLHPVNDHVGRVLLKIVEDYLNKMNLPLSLGQKRTRAKRQKSPEKSPEELVKDIERAARPRPGQVDFREALLVAYGGRCAISGCNVDAALSAAHILDYRKSECQEEWNGILLRADIHLLFDRHLLRIFPANPPVVVLDEEIRQSEAYKQFHLHPLRLPNPFDERTNQELRRRWEAANQEFRPFPDPPHK